MKLYIGCDHAGFKLKKSLLNYLKKQGHDVVDCGAKSFVKTDDYPDYAVKVARSASKNGLGILVCGSSEGVCIAANKIKGGRAVSCWTQKSAKLSRSHNDANVLCLSGWDLSLSKAKGICDAFLKTEFSGDMRHLRRIQKIRKLER